MLAQPALAMKIMAFRGITFTKKFCENEGNMKKIILIVMMLFSFIGLAASLDEYRVEYDEITATVDHT